MRRRLVLASTLALAGCGLAQRPYAEKREWPLAIRRPAARPPAPRGAVLLVRTIQAVPGVEARGLRTLEPDGSLRIDFYEEWAVPPAEAIESDARLWLADAGLFRAVVAPGSRLNADLVLEGVLTAFVAEPRAGIARAALAVVLLDQRRNPAKVLLQRTLASARPLASPGPEAIVGALRAAVADLLGQLEAALRPPYA